MLPDDIHHAYLVTKGADGRSELHPAGRFFSKGGSIRHLEDYHGLLRDHVPEGPVDGGTLAMLASPPARLKHAASNLVRAGHRQDVLPEHSFDQPLPARTAVQQGMTGPLPVPPRPASIFHYTRVGHDQPHVLEVRNGQHLLDGNPLASHEVATILENVKNRSARLRYAKHAPAAAVAKMERVFENLKKAEDEMDPQDALTHLDTLGGDDRTRGAVAALRRHLFEDPMNPGVGNKYAYEEFRKKNQPGVWTSMDVNDLKHLNDTQGHNAGDSLIRGFGGAARAGVDPQNGKLFRAGGDEYVMWHPTAEHAHAALRNIRHHVDQLQPINGTHRVSFSAGVGQDFPTADKALYAAKAQKKLPNGERAFAPGQTPHFAHSLLPGGEGPIPLAADQKSPAPPKLPEQPKAPALSPPPASAA